MFAVADLLNPSDPGCVILSCLQVADTFQAAIADPPDTLFERISDIKLFLLLITVSVSSVI